MRAGVRLKAALLLVGALGGAGTLAGCGDKSDANLIHVVIDATKLSPTERMVITSLSVKVTGDRVPVDHTYPIGNQLADGETSFPYYPGIDSGILVFRVGVNDINGTELSWTERAAEVGGEVRIELQLGAQYDGGVGEVDGGEVDAGDMCATAACGVDDGCCASSCTPTTDRDCNGCGNGRLESGETCDPPGSCLSCDDMNSCTVDSMTGSAAACTLLCSHTPKTCNATATDQCCPMGCTAATDMDCAGCGNGAIDTGLGETCDPPSSCPTAATCVGDANNIRTFVGAAATCNARCNTVARPCSNVSDTFCPSACTPVTDVDCAGCGNGRVEAGLGEFCDPPGSCPLASGCVSDANKVRTYSGSAALCTARCTSVARACSRTADTFCPTACTAVTDVDCPGCGNNRVEAGLGETCDGNCPACGAGGACFTAQTGSAATCNLVCPAPKTTCGGSDACCPFIALNPNAPPGGMCQPAQDRDCTGDGWNVTFYGTYTLTRGGCLTVPVRVYGMAAGGSYSFTTCHPAGVPATGDARVEVLTAYANSATSSTTYPVNVIDRSCSLPQAVPRLAGFDCSGGQACAGNTTGGFVLPNAPAGFTTYRVDLQICDDGTTGGSVPLYIFYNAPDTPNGG